MKLSDNNFKVKLLFFLLFLLNHNIYANDDLEMIVYPPYDHPGLIYEFFSNNPASLYFLGVRHFYLSAKFGFVTVNDTPEHRFTNLIFIIPFAGREGIVIESYDRELLDAFVFVYDPEGYESSPRISDRFEQKDLTERMDSRLVHRHSVLSQLDGIRFDLRGLNEVNTYFRSLGIKLIR